MKVVVTSASDIGNAVRQARKASGLTQDVLSVAAGVGPRFVVELEGGKSSLQLDKVAGAAGESEVWPLAGYSIRLQPGEPHTRCFFFGGAP